MRKIYTVAVLGVGSRGKGFFRGMQERDDKYKVVAICDTNPEQISKMKSFDWFDLSEENIFYDEESFFAEKRADVLVIATFDKVHVRQCIRAMKLGYDVLLEKPISDDAKDLYDMLKVQEETGRKVTVCHELRYGPAFEKLYELVSEGICGKVMAIDAMERVAYWHQAQAYVRIQSAHNDITHPTILAKCSHDLDLVQHYAGAECETVSSVGELRYFNIENAPEGSTERCVDCPHMEACPYSAKKIYIDKWKKEGCPQEAWPYAKVTLKNPYTEEDILEGIKTNYFGKCAFRLGVESNEHVVDHQLVQMKFKNGVKAVLKMIFAAEPGRRISIFGSCGEVLLDERDEEVVVWPYGGEKQVISFDKIIEGGHGHGGGDGRLLDELYNVLEGTAKNITSLRESVECHLMGIAAEKSRLGGGEVVKVHEMI